MLSVAKKLNPLNLLQLFFPEECVYCHTVANDCLCQQCQEKLPLKWIQLNNVTTLSGYHDSMFKKLLHEIKFNKNRRLVELIGKILQDHLSDIPYHNAIWIPVPQYIKRVQERGFNPLEVLFLPFLTKNNITVHNVLQRIVDTPPLHGYTRKQRFELMKGAISFLPSFLPQTIINQHIVIYDDIYTTGATMDTIFQLLSRYNITQCHYVTLTVTE